jgi:serine/threonine protein kinase/tetratricopeptide (TPR) repeat protein
MSQNNPNDESASASTRLKRSVSAPPQRVALASQLDRARAFSLLFGEPMAPVRIGRFTLLEAIGSGGMGEVYAAYDEQLDRKVAVKLVRSDRQSLYQADERLLREAQTLAQLSHPNVVQVYEAGRFEGRVFITMEFIQGQTLRDWLREHAPPGDRVGGREVLRQFIAAGRGLQAAHAAGLVHRDFKPDNVLVGNDDRPRVVDFGLARLTSPASKETQASGRSAPADAATPEGGPTLEAGPAPEDGLARKRQAKPMLPAVDAVARWSQQLGGAATTRGRILGTPQYMAPEQMRGEVADQRCDQFSFCVALYEALHGQTPFPGTTCEELLHAIESHQIREPPRGLDVPLPVRRALVRGLSADPAARFPDMAGLLAALRGWPRQRQRRVAALALLGALLIGSAIHAAVSRISAEPCADVGASVTILWNAGRREAIRDAFARTGLVYAGATWAALEPRVDQYATRLRGELETTCKATQVQGVQSFEVMEQRTLCLAGRQARLNALLDQLGHADATVVERAHQAASDLPDLATCGHTAMLRYGMKPPPAGDGAEIRDIRDQLARAHTQGLLGHGDEARRIARDQLARADKVGYGPVRAEALHQTGRVLVFYGDAAEMAEGEDMLLRAVNVAESERHDELTVAIWNDLVLGAARSRSRTKRAHAWHERAIAAVQRIGDPRLGRANALRNVARLHYVEGDLLAAEQRQRQALALVESEVGVAPLVVAVYLHDFANTLRDLGRHEEARKVYERTLVLHQTALGQDHPYVADVRLDIAVLHTVRGALDTASRILEEFLRRNVEALGKDHPLIGRAYIELASVGWQRGTLGRAHEHARRGIAIYERVYGKGHVNLAAAYAQLGAIAFRRGAYEDALAAYQAALDLERRNLGDNHPDVALSQANIGEAMVAQGWYEAALAAIEQATLILGSASPYEPFLASVRGRVLLGQGRFGAAVEELERAVEGLAGKPGADMTMEGADACWALARAVAAHRGRGAPQVRALARRALAVYDLQGPEIRSPRAEVLHWLQIDRR